MQNTLDTGHWKLRQNQAKQGELAKLKQVARRLLLLTSCFFVRLPLASDNLSEHDNTVSVHEGDARQALAIFERVAHKWLLRLESTLCHFVRLERVGVFHLLSASFLAHFPDKFRQAAGRTTATHESDRRVSALDIVRDV